MEYENLGHKFAKYFKYYTDNMKHIFVYVPTKNKWIVEKYTYMQVLYNYGKINMFKY